MAHTIVTDRPRPFFSKLQNSLLSVIKIPVAFFPDFPKGIFYATTIIPILLTLICAPFANKLDKFYLTHSLSSTSINFITSLGRSVFFDPIIWEIITALIASWVGYKIINKIHPRTIKPLLAALLPWTVLLVSYLLVEIIFKPSFNYSRPLGYSIINEPPIVSLYNRIFGAGESAPSGFVVRQMVLALTVILLNHHPQSLSKTKFSKILVDILATLSVIFIGFWRVGVGAHSLFDVVFAIGCGSIIFWLTYVIPYSLLHKNGALNSVSAMFLLFIGVFVFYANNPARWMISSFAFLVLLRLIEYINKDPHTL